MPKQKNKARMIFNNAVKNSNDMQHALNWITQHYGNKGYLPFIHGIPTVNDYF
jgi:hypothetical protein